MISCGRRSFVLCMFFYYIVELSQYFIYRTDIDKWSTFFINKVVNCRLIYNDK